MNNKDQQRKALALLVTSIILFIYLDKVLFPYLNPKPVPTNVVGKVANSVGEVGSASKKTEASNSNESKPQEIVAKEKLIPSEDEIKNAKAITIETPLYIAEISKIGGRIISFKLREHKEFAAGEELFNMVSHSEGSVYPAGLILANQSDISTNYQVSVSGNDTQASKDRAILSESNPKVTVTLKGTLPNNKVIEKYFDFNFDSYLYSISAEALADSKDSLSLEWVDKIHLEEANANDTYNVVGFVWLIGDLAERMGFAEMLNEKGKKNLSCVNWIGVGNKYFSTAIIAENAEMPIDPTTKQEICPEGTYPRGEISRDKDLATIRLSQPLNEEGKQKVNFKIYSGPKGYSTLSNQGFELKRLIDLGKTGFIAAPLLSFLNFLNKFVNNYGLSIVLLTICVKLCLYPLNTSQYKQMKALQALKPEMDRIKENIEDKQKQQMAMMELYKKKGVNPLGGCFPALIQMPIFIGLYSALMLAVELRHAPYGLWVHDLSAPDRLMVGGIGIPVLVVLFTVSIMVQQWITPTSIDPAQKKAMMVVPIVMFFMFMGFPAGLALYWLTNNLISIGQQQAIQYGDKSGKSGLSITIGVAVVVFLIAYLGTLITF